MNFVGIGFGNMVNASRLVAVAGTDSAPIKRMVTAARQRGALIDATYGRRARTALVTDSNQVILCALPPETLAGRMGAEEMEFAGEAQDE